MDQRNSGKWWVVITLVVLVALVGGKFLFDVISSNSGDSQQTSGSGASDPSNSPPPANAIAISIASSNTKQEWLHQSVDAFNATSQTDTSLQVNGHPVYVEILQETVDGKKLDYRSGTMISDTVKVKIRPTILSPGEESWILKFKREWQVANNGQLPMRNQDAPLLVRTPLVVAMWESRAKALGCWPTPGQNCTWDKIRKLAVDVQGWGSLGHPEWGKFKFGYGYFGESNSGTLAVLSMCMVASHKTSGLTISDVDVSNACGKFLADVEVAKLHSGKSDLWLLEKLLNGGPEYLDAVVTYESNVIATNRTHAQDLREPLVSVYPQDGTIVVGHPFAILDAVPWVTADQVTAANLFKNYLLNSAQQQAVLNVGLRPVDANVKLGSPIELAYGANPQAKLVGLEVPDTLVIDRLGEVWHKVKKHSVIALVFDKSGSMGGGKINAAVKGAQEFVKRMDPQDLIIWIPFDSQVYQGVSGYIADVGEALGDQIASTSAGGGTALYDAVLSAYQQLEEIRKTRGDTVRYGIVVLSDGQDQNSQSTLSVLESAIQPGESDPSGIQVHTIAIGDDADETVLKKIALAGNGKYWKTKTDQDVVKVYQDIATYF